MKNKKFLKCICLTFTFFVFFCGIYLLSSNIFYFEPDVGDVSDGGAGTVKIYAAYLKGSNTSTCYALGGGEVNGSSASKHSEISSGNKWGLTYSNYWGGVPSPYIWGKPNDGYHVYAIKESYIALIDGNSYDYSSWKDLPIENDSDNYVRTQKKVAHYLTTTSHQVVIFQPNLYTITYRNTYNSSDYSVQDVRYNDNYSLPTEPTRTGYTFLGWYTGENGTGTRITSDSVKTSASSQTLYSHWQQNTYNVDVNILSPTGIQDYASGSMTYYNSYSGNTYSGQTDQPENLIHYNGYIRISNISPSKGMYVSSVTNSGGSSKGSISKSGSTYTYTFKYGGTPNEGWDDEIIIQMAWRTSNITLNKYGGSGGSSSVTATYNSSMPTISVPTKYGYDFGGYYWNTNGGGTKYYDTEGKSVHNWDRDTNSTTLEAYWIPKSSNIVYLPNGGSGTMTTEGNKYFYGQPTALTLNTYYRTGYSFVGWHWQQTLILDKSKISDSYDLATQKAKVTHADGAKFTVSNEDDEQSLYAIWRNNKYYVKYNGNVEGQGVGGNCQSSDPVTGSMSNSTHYYNISSNLTDNGYSRKGYTFIGWATDSDETSERYTNQASISTLSSTDGGVVDLFAIWQRNTYTITFNANGGSGTTSSLSMLYNNGNYTLPKSGYSKAGYVFEGWTTNLDGTGTFYKDGATVNSYDFVANTILYAKWRATWITSASSSILGSGTQSNPYIISKAEDLAYLAKQVQKGETYSSGSTRKYFEQTAPINLTGKIWLPIGGNSLREATTAFGGVYNGRGFAIIGLETYNQTDASGNQLYNNVGLFGRTNGARLENVNISNAKIYGKTNVGALIGENYGKPLEMYGCFARGEINGSTNVGGLLGKDIISGSQISNSGFAGNVTNGSIIAGTMVGGIVKNCYAEVTTDISFVGSGATIDACVYSANGNKRYYDDKTPNDGYFTGWVTYDGKPLPSGLTWIGGVEGGYFSLDGYTRVG